MEGSNNHLLSFRGQKNQFFIYSKNVHPSTAKGTFINDVTQLQGVCDFESYIWVVLECDLRDVIYE